jgi:response regulator RpfG family c-di-GMP phosphodiesterase
MSQRILLVDDDLNILQGYKRQLRKRFQVETAPGGKEGLETLVKGGPFAVIVSDMQMPKMNGIQFLNRASQIAPDSVRMMLTGNADQKTAMDGVNDGHIFRFLTKPCSLEAFTKALEVGIEQYRLITAERDLLSTTLSGSVSVLTDILSLVNPVAFGHTTSVRRLVRQICQEMQVDNAWEIEIGATLSQVGCITIPESTLAKLSSGAPVSADELRTYQGHPQVGCDLISKIPRLKGAAEIIAYQQKCFDGSGVPNDRKTGDEIPFGARVLKLAIDANQLISAGKSAETALAVIHDRQGRYDPRLIDALTRVLATDYVASSVTINDLAEGMVLDDHVVSKDGGVLIARGMEVTMSMRERLKKFSESAKGVQEPIRVRCPVKSRDEVPTREFEKDVVPSTVESKI